MAEEGATELAGTEAASLTEAGAETGLEGTTVGDFSVSETGEVEESFTEVDQDLLDRGSTRRAVEDPRREQLVEGRELGHEGPGRA